MNVYQSLRQAGARVPSIGTAILVASLVGCTSLQHTSPTHPAAVPQAGAPTGDAPSTSTPAAGAAAGSTASATAGAPTAAAGDLAAKKKEGSAPQESALNSQLTGLNHQITVRKAYNEKLREAVTAKEQQLTSVLALDRSSGPTVQEFELRTSVNSKIGEVDRAARSWQETIDAHKAVLKGASTDARGPELDAEITRLSEQKTELLRQRDRLSAIIQKLAPPTQ